ncbi:general substrate transporter [Cerioporus squamosus]|nr:general substrate transporter [Cerioporus squamosus]
MRVRAEHMTSRELRLYGGDCRDASFLVPLSSCRFPERRTQSKMWIMPLRGKYLVWAITACCCQGFLLLGYDQGVMSGIIGADNQFGRDFNSPDPTTQGTIITSLRSAQGNGFNSSSIPVYQSETCGGMIRGALVCLNSTVTIIGLVIAYWLDYGMSYVDGPAQWRLPIGFQAVFALCLLLQVAVLPDSPRWCMAHGRGEEGARILAQLEDRDSPDHPDVVAKRKEIEVSLAQESAGGPFRYRELLQGGPLGNFRRICLCIGVNVMQQFTGYLAPVVYQNTMGLSRNLSLILGGFTAVTYMLASFIPLWTVDRFGRRALLMTSASGLSVCFILASILLSVGTKGAAYGATAMVFIFQIFLGIGYLPIPWLYPAEITTTRIRARGSAISSFFNWMCVFAVVEMTPPAIANINWRVFIIFAIFNALWVPLVYIFFPETKGLELEDVDHIFEKGGITGGVWSSPGGRTVERKRIARDVEDAEHNEKGVDVRIDESREKGDE